jgi:NAD-dependent histone deacetylase SIR2
MPVDDAVKELCKLLGWEEDLMELFEEVGGITEADSGDPSAKETEKRQADEGTPLVAEKSAKTVVDDLSQAIENVKLEDDKPHSSSTSDDPILSEGNKGADNPDQGSDRLKGANEQAVPTEPDGADSESCSQAKGAPADISRDDTRS